MSALQDQVGGSHYREMGMQPFVFTMANNWDPLAHTILKYISRFHQKNGKVDLEKAKHCVRLRFELRHTVHDRGIPIITIASYLGSNGAKDPMFGHPAVRAALEALSDWVYSPYCAPSEYHDRKAEKVFLAIQDIIESHYGEE